MQINMPEVVAEVTDAHHRYNKAIDEGDVATLNGFFNAAPQTLRYGPAENLFGYDAIANFRSTKWSGGERRILRTDVSTYGRDFGTAAILYERPGMTGKVGRQMQTWVRFPEGWRIVAAHVSVIELPKG